MSLSGLKTFAYNILKETGETIDQNISGAGTANFTELPLCSTYKEKILTLTYESFTILECGHVFRRDSVSSQISGTSTLVDEFYNIEINSPRISSQDRDVDMGEKISSQDQDVDMGDRDGNREEEKEKESQVETQSDSTG
ncbi:9171_t:CDS:2 [Paraglomus brasilianum]|uniref:9171_t:CDS:1 n=1 Tax=Paraglomus brasilianum TaxID=144538 RepID=A0A9N9E990_9GLOM|nr:9171_t:CDS:2 [Paraglomus brasilianum]